LATAVWTGLTGRRPVLGPDRAASVLARVMGSGPADLYRLSGKGRLAEGADADLVLLDPGRRWQLGRSAIEAKAGWSAYEGWVFTGRFTTAVRGGRIVWDLAAGFHGGPDGRLLTAAPRLPEAAHGP
jgi:dihydroorotase